MKKKKGRGRVYVLDRGRTRSVNWERNRETLE